MFQRTALASSLFAAAVSAQGAGTLTPETHPSLPAQVCTSSGCTDQATKIVLDANWRWTHDGTGTNCYTGNEWDASLCPDNDSCASKCVVDGADYEGTYGITTSGNAVTLKFVTDGQYSTNIGSRVYLMKDDSTYQKIPLLNQEFTFDVDVSELPCGLNGALYFSDMAANGGLGEGANKAGAKYGTGYCDAQCPKDIKFIAGSANVEGWTASESDPNAGNGDIGTCCSEMDIWEANSVSTAYTPHPCSVTGATPCTGTECGSGDERYEGVCDKDGCDFNSFRMGNQTFYGEGKTLDTKKKMTVVTQFITDDGTSSGTLTEIKRKYVQDGTVFENSFSDFDGIDASNSISDAFCDQQKTVFEDENHFKQLGGLAKMGERLGDGMVLALSIWSDHAANLLWLDSSYPVDADPEKPGIARGECATDSGKPDELAEQSPDASVTYSNIKWGDIDSTY